MKFVETGDPDVLETRRGGGVATLFGLPFFATGLVVIALAFGEGAPPLYVTLSFGAVFLLLGAALTFGRAGTTVDRRQGTIMRWAGLLVPMRKTTRLLSYYDRVLIQREVRRGEQRSYTAYPILLCASHGAGEGILFADPSDYPHARRTAERISRFTRLPLVDVTSGSEVVRAPAELDESLRGRARRAGERTALPAPPPDLRAEIREDAGTLVVEIPPRKLPARRYGAMVILVLVGAAALALTLGPDLEKLRSFEASDWIGYAPFLVAIPLVASRALLRRTGDGSRVTVSGETLRVERRGARDRRTVEIPVSELETFVIGDVDRPAGLVSRAGSASPTPETAGRRLLSDLFLAERGPSITASSDRASVSFGRGLGEEELRYLHALLKAKLTGD